MIKFGYTILYVKDVERSITFYENAFGFKRKFMVGDEYGELDTGPTTLSFASFKQAKSNLPNGMVESRPDKTAFGIEIAFTTPDVEEVFKKAINAGAAPEAEAQRKPHGQTVAYVRDPDGFLVEICTPMELSRRSTRNYFVLNFSLYSMGVMPTSLRNTFRKDFGSP